MFYCLTCVTAPSAADDTNAAYFAKTPSEYLFLGAFQSASLSRMVLPSSSTCRERTNITSTSGGGVLALLANRSQSDDGGTNPTLFSEIVKNLIVTACIQILNEILMVEMLKGGLRGYIAIRYFLAAYK